MRTVANTIAHLHSHPMIVRSIDVQAVNWMNIPMAFRDHAETLQSMLRHSVNGWMTLGEYAMSGDYVTVVACKVGGRVEYGHLIDDAAVGCVCGCTSARTTPHPHPVSWHVFADSRWMTVTENGESAPVNVYVTPVRMAPVTYRHRAAECTGTCTL